MRGIWRAAPLALRHYPGILAATTAAVALAAAAAASAPFIRAGIENASLRGQVRSLSPLATGLERRSGGDAATDVARRKGAGQFGRAHGFSAQPVLTSRFPAQVTGTEGFVQVVVMARTNAVAHVPRLAGGGPGTWISSAIARQFHLHPGDTLRLDAPSVAVLGETIATVGPEIKLRVAGVYRALDSEIGNPYWANFSQDIYPPGPDAGLPPTFVLVPEATFLRIARRLRAPEIQNTFEYPTDPGRLTVASAQRLQQRYRAAGGTSALGNALTIARLDVNEVSATISLLSGCGLLISLVVAGAAGAFLVRRRADEAWLLFARGESPLTFGARTVVEVLLPALVGAAAGFALALLTLDLFAPSGTIDAPVLHAGIRAALVAAALSAIVLAGAAVAAFPRRHDRAHPLLRRLARIPWEVVPLAASGTLLGLVAAGNGLAGGARSHPSLAVFLLPVLAAAGLAGLTVRLARRLLRGRGSGSPVPVFLALRRVAAARGFLAAVAVTAAAAVAVFAYAATLSASLQRTAAEKAFVANGSDVQGFVDPSMRFLEKVPFPAAIVRVDQRDAFAGDLPVDIVSGDPAQLARVVRWGDWPDDPRPSLRKLADAATTDGALPVMAAPGTPSLDAITYQGVRMPVRIVARGPFPGVSAGRAALLVPEDALHSFARAHGVQDPALSADGLVWAKGDPHAVEPVLARSSVKPVYLTTLDHVRDNASVVAGERSYTYLKAIGAAAVTLALLALLLYFQARQRGQVVASALARRMGLPISADTLALALEASGIVAAAGVLGVLVAVGAAALVVPHVDPLSQYAPGTSLVFPWLTFLWVGAVAVALTAVFSTAAVWAARRSNVAEALRVA